MKKYNINYSIEGMDSFASLFITITLDAQSLQEISIKDIEKQIQKITNYNIKDLINIRSIKEVI